jgi:hypothetical protein
MGEGLYDDESSDPLGFTVEPFRIAGGTGATQMPGNGETGGRLEEPKPLSNQPALSDDPLRLIPP